jgi:hypothetical protein
MRPVDKSRHVARVPGDHARDRRPGRARAVTVPILSLGALAWGLGGWGAAVHAADRPLPQAATHLEWNGLEPIFAGGDGTAGISSLRNPPNPVCTTTTTSAADVNTDCEGTAPHNETSIAVNPTNMSNLIGGANDYQLNVSSGGTVYETIYTRAHVTADGGRTWSMVGLQQNAYSATGDPAVAFDATGRAYMATLGFGFSQGNGCCRNPDVVVATSTDGGSDWSALTRVASGSGVFGGAGVFNDKEYIAAWGNGNAIVTWTVFNQGPRGSYISSPIFDSVTHDGGASWSIGQPISGSAPFCVGAQGGNACNQDQFSTPAVGRDGSIRVSFENTYNVDPSSPGFGRDQYLVVAVDPATGRPTGAPVSAAGLVDGAFDYPINEDGRQTLQDSEFRTNSSGDVTADPTTPGHFALVWSDMRNSTLPSPSNPYAATTNSDVVVSQSFDWGATWSSPKALAVPGDQFQPWGAYDAGGGLRIGYFDRSYDAANHKYGYTVATEKKPGSLAFSTSQVTDALSDPTQGDRWFSGRTPNPAFPHPSSFIGDYSGIAARGAGGVALWTDMRGTACFTVRCGAGEDAFFAAFS